jgi:RecA-family ATPase
VLRHPVALGGENGWDGPPLAEAVTHLAETQGVPYGLIVVDTLARAIGGADENAGPDMGALLRAVEALRDATGAHVMLVHHTGKDQSRGARGHSSLFGAIDTELTVSVDRETKRRTLTVTKQRDGEDGRDFGFRLRKVPLGTDKDGDQVFSCIIDHEEEVARSLF